MFLLCDCCVGNGTLKVEDTGFLGFFCKKKVCHVCDGKGMTLPKLGYVKGKVIDGKSNDT